VNGLPPLPPVELEDEDETPVLELEDELELDEGHGTPVLQGTNEEPSQLEKSACWPLTKQLRPACPMPHETGQARGADHTPAKVCAKAADAKARHRPIKNRDFRLSIEWYKVADEIMNPRRLTQETDRESHSPHAATQ